MENKESFWIWDLIEKAFECGMVIVILSIVLPIFFYLLQVNKHFPSMHMVMFFGLYTVLIGFVIWGSLKLLDYQNKLFNKYTFVLLAIIFGAIFNSVVIYYYDKKFDFAIGIFPLLISLLVAKFTKVNNHRSDSDLMFGR